MKKRVVLGMSGGIDSSTSAYLLKKQGYEVIGVTFKLYSGGSRCCDISDITNAQTLANKLGIRHYLINLEEKFNEYVINYFLDTYSNGKTPNPCVVCNEKIKIPFLIEQLNTFDADYVATGHYCDIVKYNGAYFFSKAKDQNKTQEYFLARVNKKYLSKILFPLAKYDKNEILIMSDQISKELNYSYRKSESQELCFIKPTENYSNFIKKYRGNQDFDGLIVDKNGKILKKVDNIFKYTIGQRKGLGIADETPYYVIDIDFSKRKIVVGKKDDVYSSEFYYENFLEYDHLEENREYSVKIRYRSSAVLAKVVLSENKVILQTPINAVTPGQLAVFYSDDMVVASAWIK